MKKEKLIVLILSLLFIVSIFFNFYFLLHKEEKNNSVVTGFSFLDPTISTLDVDDFLMEKEKYTASYTPLRKEIETILSNSKGKFGIYFEDLEFHAWFGINEREDFKPASLLKITTVAAILKEVEEGELSLDQKTILTENDVDKRFGELYKEEGSVFTIKELIEIAMRYSDNTAVTKLHKFMLDERWEEARLSMGLPIISVDRSREGVELTPKQFSNVFRSLYYSNYLSRSSSNWVLMLLSDTAFESGIPAGVPSNVKVAHKIGVWVNNQSEGSVHDCGIVYATKPYILCIMSDNTTTEEGNEVIEEISRVVYEYVTNPDYNQKTDLNYN